MFSRRKLSFEKEINHMSIRDVTDKILLPITTSDKMVRLNLGDFTIPFHKKSLFNSLNQINFSFN
jgi:hypothetical protein